MECRETERLINAYINDKLDTEAIETFVNHIESCDSCREELSIQYLVEAGMKRLEDGSAFDLQKELQTKLEQSKRKVIRRKRIAKLFYVLEMAVILLILIMTIMVIIK